MVTINMLSKYGHNKHTKVKTLLDEAVPPPITLSHQIYDHRPMWCSLVIESHDSRDENNTGTH